MTSEIDRDEIITKLCCYAENLGKKVYVVGGAIRDLLMGFDRIDGTKDYDLAGNLTIEEIKQFLVDNNIYYVVKNSKLEVIGFSNNSEVNYEYARMRKEEYKNSYSHVPYKIEFVESVEEDSKRRDFSINSIYYDRHNRSLLDPCGGINDIKNKTIRPVLGEETFVVDPARIIRFVEIVSRFNLKVSDEVWQWVKKYSSGIKKLGDKRLLKEVQRLKEEYKYKEEKPDYLKRVLETLRILNLQELL